uniref:ATP synthase subunit f, mitochondrial n=1 Tax=Monopterus albus TaxID=43700 RepID=A0A3Q3JNB2_MONAL
MAHNPPVCPFCGKTYKRLKSHLPHCKAAGSSKPPPTQHHVTAQQTPSSQVAAAKEKELMQTPSVTTDLHTKKSKKVSVVSEPLQSPTSATPTENENTSSSKLLSLNSESPPPSAKKKKHKLSDQIKMAGSSSPTLSKPNKKSLLAVIEAAKSKRVFKEFLEETGSVSEDLLSGLTDHLNSRTTAQPETRMNPDSTSPAHMSTNIKPKDVHKKKASKTKKKNTSDPSDAKIRENSSKRPSARDSFCIDNNGEVEDLPLSKMFLNSESGHQARITLQDVKAMLRRAKTTGQSSRASMLSQTETVDDLHSKSRPGTSLSPVAVSAENQKDSSLVTTKTMSEQLPSTSSQHTQLHSVKKKSSQSLIPVQSDCSPQPKLAHPVSPLLSALVSSQVSQPIPVSHPVNINEGLKVGHHRAGPLSISPSPTQFSSPHPFLLAPPVRMEALRPDEGLTPEKSQLDVRKQSAAHSQTEG